MRPLFKIFTRRRYFKFQLTTITSIIFFASLTCTASPNHSQQFGSGQLSITLPYSSSTYFVNGKSEQLNEEGQIILDKSHIIIRSADFQERFNIRSANTSENPIILSVYNSHNSNGSFKLYFDALAILKEIKAELPSQQINFKLKPKDFLFSEIKQLYSLSTSANRQSLQTNPKDQDYSAFESGNFDLKGFKSGLSLSPTPSNIKVSDYNKYLGSALDAYPDLDKALKDAKAKKRKETLKIIIPIAAIGLVLVLLLSQLKKSKEN